MFGVIGWCGGNVGCWVYVGGMWCRECLLFVLFGGWGECKKGFGLYIMLAYLWHTMRVILDLEENVLEKLAELAKFQKRSRKNFMEFVLTNHAEVAEPGTPEEVMYSVHNKASQNKAILAPQTNSAVDTPQPKHNNAANVRKPMPVVEVKNLNTEQKTNYTINTEKPVRMEGEDAIDYAGRVNEWKKLQK